MSSEKKDPKNQSIGAAFPGEQGEITVSGLNVNLDADAWSTFNPNYALSALQTYNTMNNVANKMFGIEAIWFRAVPQQRSKDVIFQEYTLSCVEDTPTCIKVMISDGNFPDSNYQYDLMGLEYQVPTEVQIDKKYWEDEFGFGTAPQKKDIVYLQTPNKLYQVESSYLKRGFMEQETHWMVNLIKYQPEASRKEGDDLKETIDKYTVSEGELFGDSIDAEIEKLTDKKQMSPLSSTSEDKYKEIDKNLKIESYNFDIWGIVVAESAYDLSSPEVYNAIRYKNSTDIISKSEDRSVTAWISPQSDNEREYTLNKWPSGNYFEPNSTLTPPANYKIKISGAKRFAMDDTFIFYRSEKQNLYAKVIDDNHSAQGIYWVKIDNTVISHMNSIEARWESRSNWKMKVKDPINIIDGKNENNQGFVVNIFANQYIKVTYGSQEHIAVMDEKLENKYWYGIVINIGNTWEQYNVHVWKPSTHDKDQKLDSLFYETIPFITEETTVDEYTLNKSQSYMTNIRLFNSTIEEEKQIQELLSYFTQNADKALILDNCDSKFRAPYISQQR